MRFGVIMLLSCKTESFSTWTHALW